MKILQKWWYIIVLLIIGFTPIYWFFGRNNILINGVDTNFPLDPALWFMRRFYAWNDIANGGSNFASSTAGLFFHSIQAFPYYLGLNLQQVQIFSLVFWFMTIVFASFLLARQIVPKKPLIQILFVVLYSFNIYLFNTWENVKVANLSLVAALPLGIYVLLAVQKGSISRFKASLLSLITGVILSGSGINPAYFISFFLAFFIIAFCEIVDNFKVSELKHKILNVFLIAGLIFLINLFWIVPTFQYIFSNISTTGSLSDIGFANWLNSLSENTSILNIIRIQGAWDWYALDDKSGLPLYIPYSNNYFNNPIFILFSFLIPGLVVISFLFRQVKKNYLYISFGLMVLLGIFLGVGTHPPTGIAFRLLAQHIPFFSLFRSPWYIFTPMMIMAYAALIALFLSVFDEKWKHIVFNKLKLSTLLILILIIGNMIYCYPLVLGKIFRPGREDSFYVNFPQYLFESKEWLAQKGEGRMIGYPDDEIEQFSWGYRGIESILQLLTNREVLFSSLNATDAPISKITQEFYRNLKRGQLENAELLAAKLSVKNLFEKKDQRSLAPALPEKIHDLSHHDSGLWSFYDFPKQSLPKIYPASNLYIVDQYFENAAKLLSVVGITDILVDVNDNEIKKMDLLPQDYDYVAISKSSQLIEYENFKKVSSKLSKSLQFRDPLLVDYRFSIPQEGLYQLSLERYRLEDYGLDVLKSIEVIIDSQKVVLEAENITDSRIIFKQLFFNQGDHNIQIKLNSENLIIGADLSQNSFEKIETGIFQIGEENGQKYLSLINQSDKNLKARFTVSDFDPLAKYLIQLKYKHTYGQKPHLMLDQRNASSPLKNQTEVLPFSPEWNVFSFYFQPVETPSVLHFYLWLPPLDDPLGSKVSYSEIRMYRVFTNNLYVLDKDQSKVLTTPEIAFQKVSPALYTGEASKVSGPHVIVFNENYSPDWEITLFDGQNQLINNPPHFNSNLYANTWFIEGAPEKYQFKISYKPQQLFRIGGLISIFGPILILIILYFLKKKNGIK